MQALTLSLSPAGRGDEKSALSTASAGEEESSARLSESKNFEDRFKTSSSEETPSNDKAPSEEKTSLDKPTRSEKELSSEAVQRINEEKIPSDGSFRSEKELNPDAFQSLNAEYSDFSLENTVQLDENTSSLSLELELVGTDKKAAPYTGDTPSPASKVDKSGRAIVTSENLAIASSTSELAISETSAVKGTKETNGQYLVSLNTLEPKTPGSQFANVTTKAETSGKPFFEISHNNLLATKTPNTNPVLTSEANAEHIISKSGMETKTLDSGRMLEKGQPVKNGAISPESRAETAIKTKTSIQTGREVKIEAALTPESTNKAFNFATKAVADEKLLPSEIKPTPHSKEPVNLVEVKSVENLLEKQVEQKSLGKFEALSGILDGQPKAMGLPMATGLEGGLALTSLTSTTLSSTYAPNIQTISASNAAAVTNFNAVSQAILVAKQSAKSVTVQLDPPEMGRVLIDFTFDGDDRVNVVVKSEIPDSHFMLRERSGEFLGFLKESGLENVNLSFEQSGQNGKSDSQDQSPEKQLYTSSPIDEPAPFNSPLHQLSKDIETYDGLDLRL